MTEPPPDGEKLTCPKCGFSKTSSKTAQRPGTSRLNCPSCDGVSTLAMYRGEGMYRGEDVDLTAIAAELWHIRKSIASIRAGASIAGTVVIVISLLALVLTQNLSLLTPLVGGLVLAIIGSTGHKDPLK